eukprot:1256799-Rhodomonas_salina.1
MRTTEPLLTTAAVSSETTILLPGGTGRLVRRSKERMLLALASTELCTIEDRTVSRPNVTGAPSTAPLTLAGPTTFGCGPTASVQVPFKTTSASTGGEGGVDLGEEELASHSPSHRIVGGPEIDGPALPRVRVAVVEHGLPPERVGALSIGADVTALDRAPNAVVDGKARACAELEGGLELGGVGEAVGAAEVARHRAAPAQVHDRPAHAPALVGEAGGEALAEGAALLEGVEDAQRAHAPHRDLLPPPAVHHRQVRGAQVRGARGHVRGGAERELLGALRGGGDGEEAIVGRQRLEHHHIQCARVLGPRRRDARVVDGEAGGIGGARAGEAAKQQARALRDLPRRRQHQRQPIRRANHLARLRQRRREDLDRRDVVARTHRAHLRGAVQQHRSGVDGARVAAVVAVLAVAAGAARHVERERREVARGVGRREHCRREKLEAVGDLGDAAGREAWLGGHCTEHGAALVDQDHPDVER